MNDECFAAAPAHRVCEAQCAADLLPCRRIGSETNPHQLSCRCFARYRSIVVVLGGSTRYVRSTKS